MLNSKPPPFVHDTDDTDETSDTVPLMPAAKVADTWPRGRAAEPIPPTDEQH